MTAGTPHEFSIMTCEGHIRGRLQASIGQRVRGRENDTEVQDPVLKDSLGRRIRADVNTESFVRGIMKTGGRMIG